MQAINNIPEGLNETSNTIFCCNTADLTEKQLYKVVCTYVKGILAKKRTAFTERIDRENKKEVYYMSMEFLVGTSLKNNLFNLGLEQEMKEYLAEIGFDIEELYTMDPDAGLGNGGLGRLASCYMDSATGLGISMTGFSIRYEFGIFKQKIIDGWQMEFPDNWLENGEVWLQRRADESYEIKLGGTVNEWYDNGRFKVVQSGYTSVMAIPYDMYISGYDSDGVNKLVLWSAKAPEFDMRAFSRGDYVRSLEGSTMAEVISKVLYPADDHIEGKKLRLKQQYLLCSASLQSILSNHIKKHGNADRLYDFVSIHINDTHPALCVPELMRLLIDEQGYGWEMAWIITAKTLSYTNHTVMSEALECWSVELFSELLPRLYSIVCEISKRFENYIKTEVTNDRRIIDDMLPISFGQVRMAQLCLVCCHKINGVSKLHTEILKKSVFKSFYDLDSDRFENITNGIAYRRWLMQANPELTVFLRELIGDGFFKDCNKLYDLEKYKNDRNVLARLRQIKYNNKCRLANIIAEENGIYVDPASIFDVQIKRLHEYKRQLLNALHIIYLYNTLKERPDTEIAPRTFIFGAKASSGYYIAKEIISLITSVANAVNSDPAVKGRIKVVFLENYRVSLAEKIIPASEISEQISVAGKEASGTGNMKLMLNGAVTLGTLDGANVEILEKVGKDNMFLFGLGVDGVNELKNKGYSPIEYVESDVRLKKVIGLIEKGIDGKRFDGILGSLFSDVYGESDRFLNLADFSDYVRAQNDVSAVYTNENDRFMQMSLVNIANAGVFSADRSVKEYARKIWNLSL